jgi:hypothetical protein
VPFKLLNFAGGEGDTGDHWSVICSGDHWTRDESIMLKHQDTDVYVYHKSNESLINS